MIRNSFLKISNLLIIIIFSITSFFIYFLNILIYLAIKVLSKVKVGRSIISAFFI